MYDELVKMLRVCGDSNNSCGDCPVCENDGSCPQGEWEFAAEKYMLQAADAIEELQAQNNELLFRCGQAEALIGYYQAGKLPSNAPPKEGNNGV